MRSRTSWNCGLSCTFADAIGHAGEHSVTAAEQPGQRLAATADYLGLDWAWLARRCGQLAAVGTTALARPRSRLLGLDGRDAACRFIAAQHRTSTGRFPGGRPECAQRETTRLSIRRVAIFSLGGTIAMTTDPATGGVVPALSAHELLAAVPALSGLDIELAVHDFRRLPGASLTFDDLAALSEAIQEAFADGCHGAVVTQGTDTIEETAYLLDLLHDGPQPIVVTGAMRNPTQPGADGPANIHAAVLTAADPNLAGAGAVVVLGDEIHTARSAQKTHTTSPAAFASPSTGPLGRLYENTVRLNHPPRPRTLFPGAFTREPAPRVGLYTATLGDDGSLLPALTEACDGLVIAAFGAGHAPQSFVTHLETAATRIPVVLTSRIGNGSVLEATYSFPGSEKDLLARGLIWGGALTPYKARLLLHVLLAQGRKPDEIKAAFRAAAA
jgi:L-asparaginase